MWIVVQSVKSVTIENLP